MKITFELEDFELINNCQMSDFKDYIEEEIAVVIYDNLSDWVECSNIKFKFKQ